MSGSRRDERPAREVSLASDKSILQGFVAHAVPAILVTIICISATAAYETAHDGNPVVPVDWKSVSDENLLYYYIYNPGKLDYSRFEWGGTVLYPGDKGARTSMDPDHLTLPVFAFDEVDLTDEVIVRERISAYYPEMSIDGMTPVNHLRDGKLYSITYRNATDLFTIEMTGAVVYHSSLTFSTVGDDIVGSNESARTIAFDYIANHGGLPSDIGQVQVGRSGQRDQVKYRIDIGRSINGLPTLFDSDRARILMYIDGRTGRVMSMQHGWPEARLAFYVTDLPRPVSVVRYHGLNATPYEAEDWSPVEFLTYMEPDYVYSSPVTSLAGTIFMLPHWVAYEPDPLWPWRPDTHFCNAIFPEETVSS